MGNDRRTLAGVSCGGAGAGVHLPLTVLSIGFPLAQVSPRTAGGAEQVLFTLDRGLVCHGCRSLVLAPTGSRCHGLLIPAQVPAGVLDERAKHEARRSFKRTLEHTLARFSVDVVHMHGLDFDCYLPAEEDVPVVVSLHLPLSWYSPQALKPLRANTALVCVSRSQRASAPPDARISAVIPNGVDLENFPPGVRKGNYAVVIGRICPEKGTHLAIDAAERAGIDVVIAGTAFDYPEHQAYFETMIRPRLGAKVKFIGAVGGKAKAQLLAGARCLLVPSHAPETSSLVAMEAMASGTPVVAWKAGALAEIVTDRRTGFVVSSVEEMATAIRHVQIISQETCRREAQRRFDSEQMVTDYMNFYRKMMREPVPQELQAA
ncbi:MAG TPA: glycosyltransferase [Terriglobales bacterium]